MIYAMSESANPDDASILPDDEGGGVLAVQYLIATGRTTIGHVTGPAILPGGPAARRRVPRRRWQTPGWPWPAGNRSTESGAKRGAGRQPGSSCAPHPTPTPCSAGAIR